MQQAVRRSSPPFGRDKKSESCRVTLNGNIAPQEGLGRGVFSDRQAKRASRGRIALHVFREKRGEIRISVDRLDEMPSLEQAARIAAGIAAARNKSFYGWAVVAAKTAASGGRKVTASPQPDNPFHADIILPDTASKDKDEQTRHAQMLANASVWRARNGNN